MRIPKLPKLSDIRRPIQSQHIYTVCRIVPGFILPSALLITVSDEGRGVTAAIACSLGAFCIGLADVPAPLRHKHRQMLGTVLVLTLSSLLGLVALQNRLAEWAVILVVSLGAGLATAYGPLATSMGVCALLGIDLVFGQQGMGVSNWSYLGWLIAGGIWYTYFSLGFCWLLRDQIAHRALADCLFANADYLLARSRHVAPAAKLDAVRRQILEAQGAVMDAQLVARHVVLGSLAHIRENRYNASQCQLFNLLTDAADLQDCALAAQASVDALHALPGHWIALTALRGVEERIASVLPHVAEAIVTRKSFKMDFDAKAQLEAIARETTLSREQSRQDWMLLDAALAEMNGFVTTMAKLIADLDSNAVSTEIEIDVAITKYYRRSPPSSWWKTLSESHSAPRYALRLALAMMLGLAIAERIGGHGTWVMLTVAVVMTPSFGATSAQQAAPRRHRARLCCRAAAGMGIGQLQRDTDRAHHRRLHHLLCAGPPPDVSRKRLLRHDCRLGALSLSQSRLVDDRTARGRYGTRHVDRRIGGLSVSVLGVSAARGQRSRGPACLPPICKGRSGTRNRHLRLPAGPP